MEEFRGRLNKLVENGRFDEEDTLALSQEIDLLLLEYIRLQREVEN
ncbi:Spo0E family sporulation regulatory protein-aspartic acid phosphatase [Alkaliphilus serpentinus]|uniref:Spo0E family sporulation regulatory protein-aspartic acid phosphatase n=1 Tax=Alkaliphilus serpentinus TaxID=1482731 RepID=A0A833HPU4_9FIRM|nr:Spo0E family sporulation regulatory protein-aspartic acid phosphatase [Alkaliphilus serpentinus]